MSERNRRVFDTDSPDVDPYPLLTSLILPRPIAWVSTLDGDGVGNLAPHSFFTVASTDPPVVQFTSVGTKDTVRNVRARKEFVISLAPLPLIDKVNDTSAPYAPGQDEATEVGVTMIPSALVETPSVRDSPASIECRLHSTTEIGNSIVVLGSVVAITVDDKVLDGDHPRFELLQPLSRLGRDEWGMPPSVVRRQRPTAS